MTTTGTTTSSIRRCPHGVYLPAWNTSDKSEYCSGCTVPESGIPEFDVKIYDPQIKSAIEKYAKYVSGHIDIEDWVSEIHVKLVEKREKIIHIRERNPEEAKRYVFDLAKFRIQEILRMERIEAPKTVSLGDINIDTLSASLGENSADMAGLLEELNETDRCVIGSYYGVGYYRRRSEEETAFILGRSREWVKKQRKQILQKLAVMIENG